MALIDLTSGAVAGRRDVPAFSKGERIRWRGHRFLVVDVVEPVPGHAQVLLEPNERNRPVVSVPATDLLDAAPD